MTGGGVRNQYLWSELSKALEPVGVQLAEVSPELVDGKEALIFAFLGLQTLLGRPNLLNSVTGAQNGAIGGSIHLPGTSAQPYM